MARHAKRDEEAGGPGLGVLETRKRTRRGPDGSIITRPTKKQARAMARREKASVEAARGLILSTPTSVTSSCGSNFSDMQFQGSSNATTLTTPSVSDFIGHDHNEPVGAPVSPPRPSGQSCMGVNLGTGGFEACQPVDTSDPSPIQPGGPYEPHDEPTRGQFGADTGSWHHQNGEFGVQYGDVPNLDTGKFLLFVSLFFPPLTYS